MQEQKLDAALERGYCACLDEELVDALRSHGWGTPACLRVRPVLVLTDTLAEWGRCIRDDSGWRIELRRALLMEHPWYAVRDVLLHETAHFLVMYLHPDLKEAPHGPVFRRICARLGGNVQASGNYPPLDAAMLLEGDRWEERSSPVCLKIRKLLALSHSPNEHEARLALCKARELMAIYGEELEEQDSDPWVTCAIQLGVRRMPAEELALMSLMQGFYQVKCLQDWEWVRQDGQLVKFPVVSLSGRRSKVKVALYLRDYVRRCMAEGWEERRRSHGGGARARRDYALGYISGMREALERQEQEQHEAQGRPRWGLVKGEDTGLEDYLHRRFPRLRTLRRGGRQVDAESRQAGYAAGKSLTVRPGLGDEVLSAQPRLLS